MRRKLQKPEGHGCHDTRVIRADATGARLNEFDAATAISATDGLTGYRSVIAEAAALSTTGSDRRAPLPMS